MWREIKKAMYSNNPNHNFPTAIAVNNETITNSFDIANAFNSNFAKVKAAPENIQSSIRFSKKKCFDCLPSQSIESPLNQNKSDGPNSIPIKILKLLNKDISDQLAMLFNQFSFSGIFLSIMKTSKSIPLYKKVLISS